MAPDQKSGSTYGMEGAAAPISNDLLVLKPILGPKNWSDIEAMPDPNVFLRKWVGTVGPFISLSKNSVDEVRYLHDKETGTFTKARTTADVGATR